MELETFIKETLVSIKNGLRNANLEIAKGEGKELGKDIEAAFIFIPDEKDGSIVFDVAVTVSSESKKEGGGGIKIAIARLGADISEASTLQHVSRIKFSVKPSLRTG